MYRREDDDIKGSVDWFIITLYFVMVFCGWLSIYGASYQYDTNVGLFDLSGRAGMQLVWIGSSSILGFILLKLDSNLYDVFAYLVYTLCMLLLLLTIFIAPDIKGSKSWLVITDTIRLQPAEFAKFAVALGLARFMNGYNFKLLTFKNLSIIAGMITLPIILIILQHETGSALVYTAFILMLYREGISGMVLFSGLCAVVLFVVGLKYSDVDMGLISQGEFISIILIICIATGLTISYKKEWDTARNITIGMLLIYGTTYLLSYFGVNVSWGEVGIGSLIALIIYLSVIAQRKWSKTYLFIALFAVGCVGFVYSVDYVFDEVLQPHQQKRIKVSLGMEEDLMGAGYNVNQSKIAVGSGGLVGKGFLNGTQTKLKYVPEQDTDFIFCTVGEEQGFLGSISVLIIYLAFILRLVYLAERQKNSFGRVYGYSVASIFLFHLTINVGMVIGLTPVIGIPLPFFSYGGSSLWGFTILLFIFLRIDMSRKRR